MYMWYVYTFMLCSTCIQTPCTHLIKSKAEDLEMIYNILYPTALSDSQTWLVRRCWWIPCNSSFLQQRIKKRPSRIILTHIFTSHEQTEINVCDCQRDAVFCQLKPHDESPVVRLSPVKYSNISRTEDTVLCGFSVTWQAAFLSNILTSEESENKSEVIYSCCNISDNRDLLCGRPTVLNVTING